MNSNIELSTPNAADTERITGYLWISFAICFLCNMSAGLISTLMSVYLPDVVNDLKGTSAPDEIHRISAYISALYIAGWAAGGFTWGFISDKIGRVKALALSSGGFGLFTLCISFATSWEWVVTSRLLAGFCAGGILVITPTLLSEIWPARSRSVIIGVDSIGFPVGIFSSGLVTYFVRDWHDAFFVGALPIIIGVISLWVLKESDQWISASKDATEKAPLTAEDNANLLKGIVIFGSMLIGLWGMFSWIPTWVQSLMKETDSQTERGLAMMLLGAGGLTGGFISGWVSNALGVRRAMLLCFSGCVVISFLLFGMNANFTSIIYVEIALLALFFGISQGLLSIYIPQLFPSHIRGTFTGICFNVGRIVTAFAVFFVGALVTMLGGYSHALLSFAGIFVLGFIAVFLTQEIKNRN